MTDRSSSEDRSDTDDEPGVNKRLFVDSVGFPISFYIHEIKHRDTKKKLIKDIEKHGGMVVDTEEGADTVLVDAAYQHKATLQNAYNGSTNPRKNKIFVEYAAFVQRCIKHNSFYHIVLPKKGMGGHVGGFRRGFTEEDDAHLCGYLARVMPNKETGGRYGLTVYKQMIEAASVSNEYTWATRHTAESWKQRYKTHADWMDERITQLAKNFKPLRKQLWPESRLASRAALRMREEEEEEEVEEIIQQEAVRPRKRAPERQPPSAPSPKRRRTVAQTQSASQRAEGQTSARVRGKRRALESEVDAQDPASADANTEDPEGTSLFTIDHGAYLELNEPGPSQRGHDLSTSIPTHRTAPSSPSFFTQQTLVNSGATRLSDQISSQSKAARKIAGDSRPEFVEKSPTYVDLTSPPSRPSSARRTSTGKNPEPVSPATMSQATMPPPPPRQVSKRKVPPPQPVEYEAPYRNTRSRSRSVEPVPMVVVKTRRQRKKQPPTIEEEENVVPSTSTKVTETLVEEQVVENLLIDAASEISGRHITLDSDDAETDRNLRQRTNMATSRPFSSMHMLPSEILKPHREASIFTNQSSVFATQARPGVQNDAIIVKRSEPFPALRSNETANPKTPPRRQRGTSASSTERFPLPSTKASAVEKQREDHEKRTSYKAPAGTRAAILAKKKGIA